MSGDGHCAAPRETLVDGGRKAAGDSRAIIEEAIQAEVAQENLVQEEIDGKPCLFLTPLYRAENRHRHQYQTASGGDPPWGTLMPTRRSPGWRRRPGLTLSASQQDAVRLALSSKVVVITGGPGVGKTTLVNSILLILRAKQVTVTLCAPTGRAAKRLSESTGLEAKTIHRLLEFDPQTFGFKRGRDNPWRPICWSSTNHPWWTSS